LLFTGELGHRGGEALSSRVHLGTVGCVERVESPDHDSWLRRAERQIDLFLGRGASPSWSQREPIPSP